MDTITLSAVWFKSDQWGGEADADGEMIMGCVAHSAVDQTYMVATLAMPATSSVRTWIIDTGGQHNIRWENPPVSLTTAKGVVKTSSRVEIEIGCLGGLKVNPLVMDSSPCVLSAGLLLAAGFRLTWTPDALELTLQNGCKTTLRSRGNVPGIVESNATALTTRTDHQ
eukprot:4969013-Amphidinium_carterae.3